MSFWQMLVPCYLNMESLGGGLVIGTYPSMESNETSNRWYCKSVTSVISSSTRRTSPPILNYVYVRSSSVVNPNGALIINHTCIIYFNCVLRIHLFVCVFVIIWKCELASRIFIFIFIFFWASPPIFIYLVKHVRGTFSVSNWVYIQVKYGMVCMR